MPVVGRDGLQPAELDPEELVVRDGVKLRAAILVGCEHAHRARFSHSRIPLNRA
jgi:hypothetical protein